MTQPSSSSANSALAGGMILLAISCMNIGYGLCMLVNGLEGAAVLLGIGAAMAGLSTIFISRGVVPPPPDDETGPEPR